MFKIFIVAEGGQPAIYLNSYGGNTWIREAADELFDTCVNKEGDLQQPLSRILPFLNAMHEKYDFTWEREWRLVSDLHFGSSDVVCVILPPQGDEDLKEKFAAKGRAVISPGWSYEQLLVNSHVSRLLLKNILRKNWIRKPPRKVNKRTGTAELKGSNALQFTQLRSNFDYRRL